MAMLALRGATMTLAPTAAAAVLNRYVLCVTHIIILLNVVAGQTATVKQAAKRRADGSRENNRRENRTKTKATVPLHNI